MEDEIPEVIEVVDEAPRPFVKMLENDLSNVICQQKNIGFGSLPGSAWLLSKRNQVICKFFTTVSIELFIKMFLLLFL